MICNHCGTVKEMPDYEGPWNYDQWLTELIREHQGPNHPPTTQTVHIARIEESKWRDPAAREGVLAKLPEEVGMPGSGAGLGQSYYDAKSNFSADAFRCWATEHNRTTNCGDYKSDSKRLYPDTKGERRDLGLDPKSRPNTFLCDFCLAGDTEIVTDKGIVTIASVAGTTQKLLVPFKGKNDSVTGRGIFAEAPIRHLGKQHLLQIVLKKGTRTKIVLATPEHTWFVSEKTAQEDGSRVVKKNTQSLNAGDKLLPLKAVGFRTGQTEIKEVPFAIAQGFVFGDGCRGKGDRRPAFLPIYNESKDGVMLPYFSVCDKTEGTQNGEKYTKVVSLPRHWKELPPLDESRPFLISWLSGYFAADGTVDKNGYASIASCSKENLEFVRSVAAICGVGYGEVRKKIPGSFATENSEIYELSIDSLDVPEWFWKITDHGIRIKIRESKNRRDDMWTVKVIDDYGTVEDVYCATVDGIGAFGLAGDLMTGNCPYNSIVMQRQRKDKYGYDYTT